MQSVPVALRVATNLRCGLRFADRCDLSMDFAICVGWLRYYHGPGHYHRKNHNHQADFAYNHINCPPMVLWLGDACAISKAKVRAAMKSALAVSRSLPAQCSAIRNVIPWELIESRLNNPWFKTATSSCLATSQTRVMNLTDKL
jgi:hypothetical protein